MLKLNRTGNALNRETRNNDNDNWTKLEKKYNDVVGEITEEVFDKIVDGSKIDWSQMVDTVADLPSDAEIGETRGVKEDNKIYRFDGSNWIPISEINLNPINEVDERLTQQLADTDTFYAKESMINRKAKKPIITWVDDDGREGVYSKLKPLAEEYEIPFTSALITKYLENPRTGRLTIEQIKELQKIGFEFLSHTHNHDPNHRPTEMTEEELHEDFSTSLKLMKKYNLNHRGVVIPFSYSGWDERVARIMKEYFDYAIGTGATGPSPDNSGEVNLTPLNNYYIRRTTIERGADIVKRQIDRAVEENGWVVIVSHVDNTGSHDWWDESIARDVIEYALDKGLEFVTTEEGINRFGNIAQFGEKTPYKDIEDQIRYGGGTVIDADGEIHSYTLGKYRILDKNSVSADDGIDKFPELTHSLCEITKRNADDYPRGQSGILETYRGSEDAYHYQKYVTTSANRTFLRRWNRGIEKWGDWVLDSPIQSLDTNGMTSDSSPTVGLTNKITYTYIDSTNTDGFPENERGWLVNHALLSAGVYQYYHIANSFRVYKRTYRDGEFSDWVLVEDKKDVFMFEVGEVTLQTPPKQFEEGISMFYMPGNVKDDDKPNGDTGLVTTYKFMSQSRDRCYQEFKSYGKEDKFIRYATSGDEWGSWKKFLLESI